MVNVLEGRMTTGVRQQIHHQSVMADVDEQVWRRRLKLRSFRSPDDWAAHVQAVRRQLRAAIGPLPARTPLEVTCTGMLERQGYVVEKLLIQTQPGFYATANLYLPARRNGQAPAILNAVGHWEHSKSQDVEQARLIGQARKGYVALIWDPLGQGERFQYWDADGQTPWNGSSTQQHAAVCNPAFLIGSSVIALMAWDGIRMIDYLVSRPEVDPSRIGLTGVSGGGTYTIFLGVLDDRIKATVPVCSIAALERKHRQGQIGEPCQDPREAYTQNLDTPDLLMAHAPAALRIIGTRYDFFPLVGLREASLDVEDCYTALGIGEKTDLHVVDAHHDYNHEQRELACAWFNRWLEHDAPVAEEPCTPEEISTLWCTGSGQLLTSVGGKTGPDLVRQLAARVIPSPAVIHNRADAEQERERIRAAARRILGKVPALNGAPPVALPAALVDGLMAEPLILQARMDVHLPALLVQPPGDGVAATVVWLDDRGKAAECVSGGLVPALAYAGVRVLAADLRGWGETAWVNARFNWSQRRQELLGADKMLSYVSYMLGHWHVTQRVQDVLGLMAYLRSRPDVDAARLYLAGHGGGAVVALHAAAVDGGVQGVVLDAAFATYRGIVEAPRYVHPVADFLPDVLLHYDLPDLAAALAPARVLALNPQDALGATLSDAGAAAAYARAASMAGLLDGRVESTLCAEAARAAHIAAWLE